MWQILISVWMICISIATVVQSRMISRIPKEINYDLTESLRTRSSKEAELREEIWELKFKNDELRRMVQKLLAEQCKDGTDSRDDGHSESCYDNK